VLAVVSAYRVQVYLFRARFQRLSRWLRLLPQRLRLSPLLPRHLHLHLHLHLRLLPRVAFVSPLAV